METMEDLEERIEHLKSVISRLIIRLPNQRTDYSGVGWCAGCGALQYCSGHSLDGPEPCTPDCVLQEARRIAGKQE